MKIQLNGEPRELPDGLSVKTLLENLGIEPGRVVVELNLNIVKRADQERTPLRDGDSVEIVHFVGGG